MKKIIFLFAIIFSGCATSVYFIEPPDWRTEIKQDSTIFFYSQFLQNRKIFIDAGHGGTDKFSHGPANDVVEANLNLRVSLFLADYLKQAGANVSLSRKIDTFITLSDRQKFAEEFGAEIFISIHHNSVGKNSDEFTNYTSVYYHAREGDSSFNFSNHDIAKYIQRDLAYVMGNSGSLQSFDGTLSDFNIYPEVGFAVLRLATMPSVLVEGSFFSNRYEEQRLRREKFNKIEAWGIFRGVGKYFKSGIPKLIWDCDTLFTDSLSVLKIIAYDTIGINPKSITAKIDFKEVDFIFQKDSNIILVPIKNLSLGQHSCDITIRNNNGNATHPFRKIFYIFAKD